MIVAVVSGLQVLLDQLEQESNGDWSECSLYNLVWTDSYQDELVDTAWLEPASLVICFQELLEVGLEALEVKILDGFLDLKDVLGSMHEDVLECLVLLL